MTPVEPGKKIIGPKTAERTRPIPTRALVICSIDLRVASQRREPLLAHDPLDVLDDDDRVVDEEADGEDHREHRQHVDRVAEGAEDAEGPEDDDRDRDRRDERRPEVPEEEVHDEEDEDDRLDQRLLTTSSIATLTNGVVS